MTGYFCKYSCAIFKEIDMAEESIGFRGDESGLVFESSFVAEGIDPYDTVDWSIFDAVITDGSGNVFYRQEGVEFPSSWSQQAVNIVASKYFYGRQDIEGDREYSLKQLVNRVVDTITASGERMGYFQSNADAKAFSNDLKYMAINQVFAFNSPVWFNIGTPEKQQSSACQPYRSMVSTPEGPVPIGRIVGLFEQGQSLEVLSANGAAKVLAVKRNGLKDVYKLTTYSGHIIEATEDHLIWKATGVNSGQFVPLSEIEAGDTLIWHRTPEAFPNTCDIGVEEAALAAWLQSDGFVGQYSEGTNTSLTIEAISVNEQEESWVRSALSFFPDATWNTSQKETEDPLIDFKRHRAYGEQFRPFVEKWGLLDRGENTNVPDFMFTAGQDATIAYLKSAFQADGWAVTNDLSSPIIGITRISEPFIRGIQQLLARFGIFSRVKRYSDSRENRKDSFKLSIGSRPDRQKFSDLIGFVDDRKNGIVSEGLKREGTSHHMAKRLQIQSVEFVGQEEVFDIQTSTGEYLCENIRIHNCFINDVQDSMHSIMELASTEASIFKWGSGAGVNLSRIRGKGEPLSGGGEASGPVSFMRGYDAFAGVIKSGGKKRRAAKMIVLDDDHPDIEDFVWSKSNEEQKAHALISAGYDSGFNVEGGAYDSVFFQNANHSIRVSDDFMRAVENDEEWKLKWRGGHNLPPKRLPARELMQSIAKAAWQCRDPGIQSDDTINRWHTAKAAGRQMATNPCSEYLWLNNTACNLASLNLLKFDLGYGSNGPASHFDVTKFQSAVALVITAQDILVDHADYPTEKIAEETRKWRTLGLGYTNLGAYLMSKGVAYDSEKGRDLAAQITSLMTSTAYLQSAHIARELGSFSGYEENADSMIDVLVEHRNYCGKLDLTSGIAQSAYDAWFEAKRLSLHSGIRNAQVSVLAPTGTISFMMDCDTTGVEPELALVKYKTLVGGGLFKIVNQTVPKSLKVLGYSDVQISEIVGYIDENNTIAGAPYVSDEHHSVFHTSFPSSDRDEPIHWRGHIKMMAAVQPFLSGAISKTVNMPESATVEEIVEAYMMGWKSGLKALAVYRDNCKRSQPLSTKESKDVLPASGPVSARTRLPETRSARTHKFTISGHEGYLTVGLYDDGQPGEIFVVMSKNGSTINGLMDAFATSISINLQYGVPLAVLCEKFKFMRFEPSGFTSSKDVRICNSVVDYIFRWLEIEFLGGVKNSGPSVGVSVGVSDSADTPICPDCGGMTVRAGSCYSCTNCGASTGCG